MSDPTISEDDFTGPESDHAPSIKSPRVESSRTGTSPSELDESTLDAQALAEVDAFRAGFDTDGEFDSDRDAGSAVTADEASTQDDRTLRSLLPGPGIPEAIAWTIGVLAIHLVGMIVAMCAVMTSQILEMSSEGSPPSRAALTSIVSTLPEKFGVELMTGEMLVFLVIAVLAAWIRLGAKIQHRLGIRPIPQQHFWLIVAVSIPISLMCGGVHELTVAAWDQWFAHLPGMGFFDHLNVNESIKPLGESAPLGLLLLVIAVAPAIGEELIFRGIIGRGLIARHGIVAGVVMTSRLFAAVHIHPAHVVALLPLAFFIHLVYLTTRSFLAPMLLHLLNNSLAVVLLKASAATQGAEVGEEAGLPGYLILVAGTVVGLVGWTLWKSRVEYRLDDGSLWNPGYPTVEIPPETVNASVAYRECPLQLYRSALGMAGAYSLVFAVSLGLILSGHLPG